ncbi:chymotrypsin A-like [Asterias rubens]|uniref:chymotrypsin A-like n=1 Tax=Asterias rubens TaxID=7604 RepID=UPI0014551E6B|nr:chymotrypsin A-like [Asterias rubens]
MMFRPVRKSTMFAPCGAVAVSFVLIALLGCCIVGANGRAVKIKKSYRLQAEMIAKQRSQETLKEKKFPGRMDTMFDVITDEEEVLIGIKTSVKSERCGMKPYSPPPQDMPRARFAKVVAGIEAMERWPWQVALLNVTSREPFCGGTLIGREHIVTAAHCFDNERRNEDNVGILLGEHDRSKHEGTEQEFRIDCIHVHRHYIKGVPYVNDIAVIKLKTSPDHDVVINDYVMPACMPEKNEFQAGDTCYVTGWGYTNFSNYGSGRRPSTLNQARLPLLSHDDCQNAYGSFITKRMVCAGYMEGDWRSDTCKGDSGGPLVCQQNDGRWKLVGVTSWGRNTFCNPSPTDAVPGVYTKVERYRKWIQKQIDLKKCRTRRVPRH